MVFYALVIQYLANAADTDRPHQLILFESIRHDRRVRRASCLIVAEERSDAAATSVSLIRRTVDTADE
ncbi:hypothetical protein [Sinorhizobium psoraleae]|uniref:hypothetical protein n=1 Tax=Sinorhizobium psoraleae TaxID=520838 RepID=UPI001568B025|nr:hypothetical protein [Sinorhizobium psoraleae]